MCDDGCDGCGGGVGGDGCGGDDRVGAELNRDGTQRTERDNGVSAEVPSAKLNSEFGHL